MQAFDYTTLVAICAELQTDWIPARVEQVYQRDRHTLHIALRTLSRRDWLTLCWHPQLARLGIGTAPPRTPDTFTLSDQLRHQLNGLALVAIALLQPWERVVDLQFARRPGEDPLWHLYVEIMGKYSNVILTDGPGQIVTTAHQVNAQQSRVRTVQTGQTYEPPPPLLGDIPDRTEPFAQWQERISLVPGTLKKQLLKVYRGVSPAVVAWLTERAKLDTQMSTTQLTPQQWQDLWQQWQTWLNCLAAEEFTPTQLPQGYTVLPGVTGRAIATVHELVDQYYSTEAQQQQFQQLHHQLSQKVKTLAAKVRQKCETFRDRLSQSDDAQQFRDQADLLMAYLHQWQPGQVAIALPDFTTGDPVTIPLNPEKNAVQNAQALYKQHQKLKRARSAVEPLLATAQAELDYLEQIEAALQQCDRQSLDDELAALLEIRTELIQQGYLDPGKERANNTAPESQPRRYRTPSGFELWVGRNNRQNDHLTFRTAGEYDLWFHAQEIAGSHVLLRLEPGTVPEEQDLQCAANMAAYYSRARQSDQVPVVYTQPKFVYKPKGAKPGTAIYQREQVIWGRSQQAQAYLNTQNPENHS
jgi:predicted ribosome quality control (RQC) complex YloA/Tae2 family protein